MPDQHHFPSHYSYSLINLVVKEHFWKIHFILLSISFIINHININNIMTRLHCRQYYLKLEKTLRQTSYSERLKWILNETPRKKNIVNKIKVQERMRNYHKMDKLWHCQVIRKEKIWSIGKLNILEQLPLALWGPRGCTGVPTVA